MKYSKDKKSKIEFRVSETEKTTIYEAANSYGMSVSEFIRIACQQLIDRKKVEGE